MQAQAFHESDCHHMSGKFDPEIALQRLLTINSRWQEALHGVAKSPGVTFAQSGDDYSYATSFPQPILMGAAFDDDLIHAVATVISIEARAFSNGNMSGLNFWTP